MIARSTFILAALLAVAGPIFYRSLFAHRQRNHSSVSQEVLFKFERNLTCMVLIVPYLAVIAYVLELPRFYNAATILLALYAIYYYYPSQKRIAFDSKIFRANGVPSSSKKQ